MLLVAHLHFCQRTSQRKKMQKSYQANAPRNDRQKRNEQTEKRH
jgi:hypothetical protein